jgi:integrase
LAAFTEEWIDSALAASDRKATTKANYATIARSHIVSATIGARSLDALRPMHVEAWIVELREKGLSESSVRSAYTILRAVLDTAVRDGALARNVAAAVKRPKVTSKEAASLTPDQVRALLDAAQGSRYAPVFELLVNTGLRRGEALALRWSDVDLDESVLRVRGTLARVDGGLIVTEPKTAKSKRSVHVSPTSARVLRQVKVAQAEERLRAGSQWIQTGYVFTTETGEPCDPRNALRSTMLVNGVPLKVVSEILGHASVAITGDVYGHVSPDVSRDALAGLSVALES